MQISAMVILSEGDPVVDPDAAAASILQALGGDNTKDHCMITVQQPGVSGAAGTLPAPPEEPPASP